MRQGPLAGRYLPLAVMVVFALVPYLALSAALQPLTPFIARDLNMSSQAIGVAQGMANAGYAIGTVLALQFALHLPQRRMLVLYGVLLLIGSVLAVSATAAWVFVAGHALQGLSTSLLLIAAVPLLIVGFPAAKMGSTVVLMNICGFGPLIGGLALIVTLLVAEFRGKCALLGVRPLVSTLPFAGIVVGISAAAASVSAIALSRAALAQQHAPLHVGLLYLPEFGGAVLSAFVFGAVVRTRWLHSLVLAGTVSLSAGIVVIGRDVPPTDALTLIGSGLIGVGVGSSVTPALIIAGFSVASAKLQRVFAIAELLRAVAAFLIAPIMLHVAMTVGRDPTAGTTGALWICFGVSVCGAWSASASMPSGLSARRDLSWNGG